MQNYKKKNIQTQNESNFFTCLQEAFPDYYIGIQVSMSAIIESEYKNRSQYRNYYNDFVICDKKGIISIMVIELDDKTHKREKRIEQDIRKNIVLQEAKILFYRYKTKTNYITEEIKNEIEPILTGKVKPPEYNTDRKTPNNKNGFGCGIPLLAISVFIVITLFTIFK